MAIFRLTIFLSYIFIRIPLHCIYSYCHFLICNQLIRIIVCYFTCTSQFFTVCCLTKKFLTLSCSLPSVSPAELQYREIKCVRLVLLIWTYFPWQCICFLQKCSSCKTNSLTLENHRQHLPPRGQLKPNSGGSEGVDRMHQNQKTQNVKRLMLRNSSLYSPTDYFVLCMICAFVKLRK